MFSATQQIETAAFTSLKFQRNHNEKFLTKNNAKPSRWSLSKIAELEPKNFVILCHWYAEHIGFDGHVHIEINNQPIDVKQARDLLVETQESSGAHIMLVTASRFSSGTIDFCKNRRIDLVTNKDLFKAVDSISISEQQQLLDQIFKN